MILSLESSHRRYSRNDKQRFQDELKNAGLEELDAHHNFNDRDHPLWRAIHRS
jgi:hypothetical protein